MTDDFAVVREEIELTKSWQALGRIEFKLKAAEEVADMFKAENEALNIRDKMREDGERHLLSEIEARDAEIKALREAAWYAVNADDAKDGRFALRKALADIWGEDPS